jgi:hypothetical protein
MAALRTAEDTERDTEKREEISRRLAAAKKLQERRTPKKGSAFDAYNTPPEPTMAEPAKKSVPAAAESAAASTGSAKPTASMEETMKMTDDLMKSIMSSKKAPPIKLADEGGKSKRGNGQGLYVMDGAKFVLAKKSFREYNKTDKRLPGKHLTQAQFKRAYTSKKGFVQDNKVYYVSTASRISRLNAALDNIGEGN